MPSAGTKVTADVELSRALDAGGMGVIWVAQHAALGREVAVKLMTEELVAAEPTARDRFKREAAVLNQVDCEHIVRGHAQGAMVDGTPFIVMELLTGRNLVEELERRGEWFSLDEVDQLVAQLAGGLAHIHQFDIVHRDLKAENIFVCATEPSLTIKLIDFGLAKIPDMPGHAALTTPGVLVGSAEYMSPEQIISAATVDHQADLWGFAVAVYVAVSLELPFRGDELSTLFTAIRSGVFQPPSRHRPELGPAIDAWFTRAFHVQRIERFQSAREMAAAWSDARRGKLAPTGEESSFDVVTASIIAAVLVLVLVVVVILLM